MAKAKSTPTKKVVKKQSIAEAAKEAYLKTHTKEQLYTEYEILFDRNRKTNEQLEEARVKTHSIKKVADDLSKSATEWRKLYYDESALVKKAQDQLYWRKQDVKALRITVAMLCVSLLVMALALTK